MDDIVTRLLEMLDGSVPSTAEPQDLRDAIDEIERLRHELGMAHANLAMYIDCTAAAEIERLREENKRLVSLQKVLDLLYEHD